LAALGLAHVLLQLLHAPPRVARARLDLLQVLDERLLELPVLVDLAARGLELLLDLAELLALGLRRGSRGLSLGRRGGGVGGRPAASGPKAQRQPSGHSRRAHSTHPVAAATAINAACAPGGGQPHQADTALSGSAK